MPLIVSSDLQILLASLRIQVGLAYLEFLEERDVRVVSQGPTAMQRKAWRRELTSLAGATLTLSALSPVLLAPFEQGYNAASGG